MEPTNQSILVKVTGLCEPPANGFLNHVSKAQIVQALKEAGPDLAGDGVESMKKDVLVKTPVGRCAGRAGCRRHCDCRPAE
jgi:hypothetical protein